MRRLLIIFSCISILIGGGCGKKNETAQVAAVTIDPVQLQMFEPLPESVPAGANPFTEEKIALGRICSTNMEWTDSRPRMGTRD
jgi:hypothetical protein